MAFLAFIMGFYDKSAQIDEKNEFCRLYQSIPLGLKRADMNSFWNKFLPQVWDIHTKPGTLWERNHVRLTWKFRKDTPKTLWVTALNSRNSRNQTDISSIFSLLRPTLACVLSKTTQGTHTSIASLKQASPALNKAKLWGWLHDISWSYDELNFL